MKWTNKFNGDTGFVYGTTDIYENIDNNICNKIASFDLDNTLIRTSSGATFAKNSEDWKLEYDNVKDVLKKYQDNGYKIIIITNQGGIGNSEDKLSTFKKKIEQIEKKISPVKFEIYCLIFKDFHRKPYPTILENINFDRKTSFYCGDAAGRYSDFADTDIKFAYNAMIKFKLPEEIFTTSKSREHIPNKIEYPIVPFEYGMICREPYNFKLNDVSKPELIIMVGLPASGKSSFAQNIIKNNDIKYISMDIIGTKVKMIKNIKACASNRSNILIDNTNLEISVRKELIDIVKSINNEYYITVIHINTSIERCKHNNCYRYYVGRTKFISELVYRIMQKKLLVPQYTENPDINRIITVEPDVPYDIRYINYYL